MTSISFHIGGNSTGNVSIEHNNRVFKKHNNRDIDVSKSAQNIQFKKSKSVKDAYDQIFEPYTEKYDQKQKRKDRKIGNYYDHLSHQKGGKGGQKDRNLVYESISTIGKTSFENGKPKPFTQKELDFKKQVLKKAEEGWSEAHPNMMVINSVMHLDESNPHIHRDFVPVFHSKTGQELQVSLNKAIAEELGVAAKRVPVRKLNKKTGKYEQVFYKNGQPKIKLDNKANFWLWSELERNRIAEIAKKIDPNFERTTTDEVDHQSVAKYKERQAFDKLEKSDEKLNRVNALKEEVSHEAADTGLTQAYFIAELMPDYVVNTLDGKKSISTIDGKVSFSAYQSDKRLMALQTAMNHQKKQANCELIRDYEPEARVEYSKKDDNEEPRKSEPIKTEAGFKAFMQQPLDWLKAEKEKYKKIIKKKYEDLKKTIKAQGFEIETLSKKNKILKSKVDEAYDYLDKFDAKTKRMTHNIKIKNQTIADLKTDKTKLSTDLENSKNENKQLKTELGESLQKSELYLKNMLSERKKFKQKNNTNNAQEQEPYTLQFNSQLTGSDDFVTVNPQTKTIGIGNSQQSNIKKIPGKTFILKRKELKNEIERLSDSYHVLNDISGQEKGSLKEINAFNDELPRNAILEHTEYDKKPIESDENGLTKTQRLMIDDGNNILREHGLGDLQMDYDGQTLREHEAENNHKELFEKKLTKEQIQTVYAANKKYLSAGRPDYVVLSNGFSHKYELKVQKQKLAENQGVQVKQEGHTQPQQQTKKQPVFKQIKHLKIEHPHNNQKQKRGRGPSM